MVYKVDLERDFEEVEGQLELVLGITDKGRKLYTLCSTATRPVKSLWVEFEQGCFRETSVQEVAVNNLKELIDSAEDMGISKIQLPIVSANMSKKDVLQAVDRIILLTKKQEKIDNDN